MLKASPRIALHVTAATLAAVGLAAVLSRPLSRPASGTSTVAPPVYEQPDVARPAIVKPAETQAARPNGMRTVNCGTQTKEGGYTSAALAGDELAGSMHVGETPGFLKPHDCMIYFAKPLPKAPTCDVRTPAHTKLESTAAVDRVVIHDVIQGADFTYTCQ